MTKATDAESLAHWCVERAREMKQAWTNTPFQQKERISLQQIADSLAGKVPHQTLFDLQALMQSIGRDNTPLLRQEPRIVARQELQLNMGMRLMLAFKAAEVGEIVQMNRIAQVECNQRELEKGRPSRATPACRRHYYK